MSGGLDRGWRTRVPGRMLVGITLQTPRRPHPIFPVPIVIIVPLNHALDFSRCA